MRSFVVTVIKIKRKVNKMMVMRVVTITHLLHKRILQNHNINIFRIDNGDNYSSLKCICYKFTKAKYECYFINGYHYTNRHKQNNLKDFKLKKQEIVKVKVWYFVYNCLSHSISSTKGNLKNNGTNNLKTCLS